MPGGLKALMQKHAEELEREQAAHRDALALCEVYEQRIAELQSQLDAARAGSYVPVDTNSLTYHMGKESYMLDGEIIVMLELPSHIRLCKLQPASAAATGKGGSILLVDEPDKFGTITVWVGKRERFQPRVEVHTTDFADDGSLIPDYKLYFYNRTFEIQEAHDFARAILLGCEIAEQHKQQHPSAQEEI